MRTTHEVTVRLSPEDRALLTELRDALRAAKAPTPLPIQIYPTHPMGPPGPNLPYPIITYLKAGEPRC